MDGLARQINSDSGEKSLPFFFPWRYFLVKKTRSGMQHTHRIGFSQGQKQALSGKKKQKKGNCRASHGAAARADSVGVVRELCAGCYIRLTQFRLSSKLIDPAIFARGDLCVTRRSVPSACQENETHYEITAFRIARCWLGACSRRFVWSQPRIDRRYCRIWNCASPI
jgi:hypothetical protein